MDSLKLELLKNKKENAQSAIASQEVREHLAGFIRSKRQGSSNQINNISGQQSGASQLGGGSGCSTGLGNQKEGGLYGNKLNSTDHHGIVGMDEDHPLRKTASMPTMHIPYKAKSLSRRRQMERRTTMSPLMRRKPKRQLLHSRDSNSTEYSSNPCIIQSSRTNTRSLSQSNSPPPLSTATSQQQLAALTPHEHHPTNPALATSDTSQSSIKLSSIYSNKELESIQNNLNKNASSYFGQTTSHQNNQSLVMDNLSQHRQQHYLKVTESIRKSVIQRANDRGKISTGGSLDMDHSGGSSTFSARGDIASISAGTGASSNTLADYRDEMRQWSLDGADLRTSSALSKLNASSGTGCGLSHIEFHRLRLATTNDAAGMRRSQSPSSSISMGLPPGPISAQPAYKPSPGVLNHLKQYSSSSSSTSSLLSAQNSLEDSSSQAIDLSSSSEAGRHRQQQQQQQQSIGALSGPSVAHRNHLLKHNCQPLATSANHEPQQCQKALQDLFNKLQLRQSQENLKQMQLLPQHQQQYHATAARTLPYLSAANKTSTSFETSSLPGANPMIRHLTDQLNLSDSAQNLILLHEQQQLQQMLSQTRGINNMFCRDHNQTDLNQWLLAYNTLIQSSELQQSGQISAAMLAKITSLPEPYKTSLITHLIQQQQHALHQPIPQSVGAQHFTQTNLHAKDHDQRSLIGRTLSSPLLLNHSSGDSTTKHSTAIDRMTSMQQMRPNIFNLNPRHPADILSESAADNPMMNINMGHQHLPSAMDLDDDVKQQQQQVQSQDVHPSMMAIDMMNSHSLDLTTSTSRSSSLNGVTEGKSASVRPNAVLDFIYTPVDPERASCNFIYNPVFDQASSTGLTYELEMCNHKCICANESNHPENSQRILAIWRRLYERGLLSKCARIEARHATIEELKLCHSETYACYFGKSPYERIKLSHLDLSKLPIEGLTQLECGGQGADIDTAWNEELTPGAARLATGSVIVAAMSVATGKLINAFAIVRPPGHHAEFQQVMGFCFFNSVAIAARVLITKHLATRVLIVDWDVHHGNGIQEAFYEDKSVMYISLHRHDKGNFFPGTGNIREVGQGLGEGYNWNIAWSGEMMGDAEYLAAFRSLVMPIAREFNPSIVLVACGFDAARGHPFNFGGYDLSPACFAYMTRQLMSLANGRLVLCLEGGYQLSTICDCAESCVRALLNECHLNSIDQISELELRREPNQSAVEILTAVSSLAAKYWPSVESWRATIEQTALGAANPR